ncbi:glycine-rich cell wall structural protein 2-like [Pyrus ussuriensis x Pyrus communis]|uniref:Glycine-rich cell wall structural protein 2-like n=1 Tax=Pyrus ussuriensis x Pyrus communis TaxID=2448454 RepID=A0A5N5HQW3_9ROSA|nr:glycine-rich cell wall structural protein 2-like [Pyrus ussuriensis x Pyrus communis]
MAFSFAFHSLEGRNGRSLIFICFVLYNFRVKCITSTVDIMHELPGNVNVNRDHKNGYGRGVVGGGSDSEGRGCDGSDNGGSMMVVTILGCGGSGERITIVLWAMVEAVVAVMIVTAVVLIIVVVIALATTMAVDMVVVLVVEVVVVVVVAGLVMIVVVMVATMVVVMTGGVHKRFFFIYLQVVFKSCCLKTIVFKISKIFYFYQTLI